jgi:hypothetical protein
VTASYVQAQRDWARQGFSTLNPNTERAIEMSTIHDFLGFDPNTAEAAETFEGRQEPIPNGKYKAVATTATRKHTKSGNGWFWELVFTLVEGEYEGKNVTHRFNMVNPSEEAVAIGRSHMKRYLDSIGNLEPKDESDLCHIAVFITIACKKNTYTNRNGESVEGINNEIVKIDPFENAAPKEQAATEKPATAPWKKKA